MLVLDANILVRAVLGKRVRGLLARYGRRVEFFVPDAVFEEACEVLPPILEVRQIPVEPAVDYLYSLLDVIRIVAAPTYVSFEAMARNG